MSAQNIDIKSFTIADLEKLLIEYPWFAYARQELFIKLAESGKGFVEEQLKKSSSFLPSLQTIYYKAVDTGCDDADMPVIDFNEFNREVNLIEEKSPAKSDVSKNEIRYIFVGGDYFTKEDLQSVEEVKSFNIGRLGSAEDTEDAVNETVVKDNNIDCLNGFYTETLARIYAQQGYYEEAMEVYAKLILLYPEKSAYFAALVDKVKSKNN